MVHFPQYKGKKVLIFGLGLNDGGLGMAEFFLSQGALVTITDGKSAEQLADTMEKLKPFEANITYHLSGHLEQDFKEADLIIRNPAIKPDNTYLNIARQAGIPIEMEISLFMKLAPCKIIGISGTRGKSTTTTLTYLFLKEQFGDKVILAGNIGKSAIRELPNLTADHIVVLEVSSFQLDAMREAKQSPHISLLTNIYNDHLNWHKDINDYIDCKLALFTSQHKGDIALVNIDDERARLALPKIKETGATLITFSSTQPADFERRDKAIFQNGKLCVSLQSMLLEGEHNYHNALGAIAIAKQFNVSCESIEQVLQTFTGVDGRQQLIREINGVKIYNDTTATSLEAMLAALNRFGPQYSKKMIMISGGVDKGLDYSRLTPQFKEYLKAIVLLEGTASEKIEQSANDANVQKLGPYSIFKDAVAAAYATARPGDMIILCPGAASFNMFVNEFDRGRKFDELVSAL